jgi:hypothetical protein
VGSLTRANGRDVGAVIGASALALALFELTRWRIAGGLGLSSFPLDDSWIHLHFARNLAEGQGFAYNPGVSVAGSTAPLWTLLLAGAFALFGSHPVWAKLLGVAAALATAFLSRRLAWQLTGARGPALAAGLMTAVAWPLIWGALSGMEVALAALLVTAAVLCHINGRDVETAGLLALSALARPEAVVLIPLVWIARPITLKRTAMFLAIVACSLAPWVFFNMMTAGSPLPATASAKIEGGLIGFLSGRREPLILTLLQRPWRFEAEWVRWLWSVNVFLPIAVLAGIAALGRRAGRPMVLPALSLLLHPIAMALLAPYRGPAFQEGRYSIHLLPLAIVVAAVGIDAVPRRRGLRAAALALVVAATVAATPSGASRYAWAVQNIDAMQVRLGEWVAGHTPSQARLGLNDVGAIAYISRREVVDMMGLVTPAVIPYRRQGEAGVLRYLERACPDYLIIFPAWFPELSSMADRFTPIYRIRLEHNTVAGSDEMVVYETAWNRWRRPSIRCPADDNEVVGARR